MLSILLPFALLFSFFRDLRDLFKDQRYRALLLWVAVLLLGGTAFYRHVEGWSWLDAFYFCVVTLATVGYGDLSPTTTLAKVFTIIYIFIGLSFFVSFINLLAQERKGMRLRRAGREESENASAGAGG
jgi:voltage-gated potassium channel